MKGSRTCAATAPAHRSRRSDSQLPDGRLAYRLKRPFGDGRQTLLLQPTELLRRLATLVPPPRAHLLRYHGVFAPSSHWRREVVPRPPAAAEHCDLAPLRSGGASTHAPPTRNPCRILWAELLLRVFREDVLSCPCGGHRVVLAYLTEPGPVKATLDHMGLPSTGPPLAPARFTADPSESGWQDDVPGRVEGLSRGGVRVPRATPPVAKGGIAVHPRQAGASSYCSSFSGACRYPGMATGDRHEVMTLEEVADYLQLSRRSVYRLAAEGKLPGRKIVSRWRFPRTEIEAWLRGAETHERG